MCKLLNISRSSYYYKEKPKKHDSVLIEKIKEIFDTNRKVYGSRKIKIELAKFSICASRRRICRIMKSQGLVSKYTIAQFARHSTTYNKDAIPNLVKREFDNRPYRNVVVSDLTYVRVGSCWNYVCILVDLFNREIIGYSAGNRKSAELVQQAFFSVESSLSDIQVFHTDRGSEFKNQIIESSLSAFNIKRSMSAKACPYDNAVAEAAFKVIKTEFINGEKFDTLATLKLYLADYVNWYNHHRIHSSLGYLTPKEFMLNTLKKVV